ncbi:MAG: PadR family transcriptional regulator [Methanolinea sp.]|nr:PadR family transcriptional regulator [Methanolinea sp.]
MPKNAHARFIVLGVVGTRPMTGNGIRKWIKDFFCPAWKIGPGTVSSSLRTLEEEGLVKKEHAPEERGQKKDMYTITGKGKKEMQRWLQSPEENDSEILLKCLFGYHLPPDVLKEKVRAFRKRREAAIAEIEMRENRIAALPDTAVEKPFLRSAARNEIMTCIAQVDWAQETLSLLETIDVPGKS